MDTINYDDFAKLELKVGTVDEAQKVEGSDKLLKLIVSLGEEEKRQIIAGIGKTYEPEDIVGKQIVVLANLEPKTLMGMESQGMLLAGTNEEGPIIISPELNLPDGARIK